jgi:hypothetical protein
MGNAKQIDSKGRLLLGNEFAGATFLVESQKDGSLLLRPAVTVPVETAWFFKSQKAQNLVKAGLKEAAQGKLKKVNWKSDSKLVAQLEDDEE